MKPEFIAAAQNGMTLIDNTFETPKGKYNIIISRYKNQFFFFKFRDGELMECRNLNTAMPKPNATNKI